MKHLWQLIVMAAVAEKLCFVCQKKNALLIKEGNAALTKACSKQLRWKFWNLLQRYCKILVVNYIQGIGSAFQHYSFSEPFQSWAFYTTLKLLERKYCSVSLLKVLLATAVEGFKRGLAVSWTRGPLVAVAAGTSVRKDDFLQPPFG